MKACLKVHHKKVYSLLVALFVFFVWSNLAFGWNYPRDGKFKQLSPQNDPWFFVDEENWDLKNPDKWQHFTGCYVSQKLLSKHMNKYLSWLLLLSIGVYKEYEDAYREGWSLRDVSMDLLGILSATYDRPSARVLCSYDQEKVMLNLVFPVK